MIGYYPEEELSKIGFKHIGKNIKISKTTTLYNPHLISIGSNVRIDNFCVIAPSGEAHFSIGNYVQISAYNFINGLADCLIEDYVTTSPFVRIFTSSDDYSGDFMTGAVVPRDLISTVSHPVHLYPHVIIGTNSTILPGVTLETGVAVGAHSLVNKSFQKFKIIAGVPAKVLKDRKRKIIMLEKNIL